MAHQLYRTNISLTGNVKLGCWINADHEITHCALAPVSSSLPYIPQDVNMLGSVGLGYDMKKFYDEHADIFYSPQIPETYTSSGQYKHLTDNDFKVDPNFGDGQYGLKRVSLRKNGKQLSLFAPIFIRTGSEIPTGVRFIIQTGAGLNAMDYDDEKLVGVSSDRVKDAVTPNKYIRKVSVPIKGTPMGDYLQRSYKGINGTNPDGSDIENIHVINIDPSLNRCATRGWSMKSGDICEIESDLMNRIFSHGMTMQEFDSYICDEYRNYQMTCPWILNLCWYFDIDDLLPATEDLFYGEALKIDAEYLDEYGNVIPVGDLDVNHRYIGAKRSFMGDDNDDVLAWLDEWKVNDIWNDLSGGIVPITNKWALSGSYNSYIFNVYPGFDKISNGWDVTYFIDHFESDPSSIDSNPTKWMRDSLSHPGCIAKFDINDVLYSSKNYANPIFDVYYNDDITESSRGFVDIIVRNQGNNNWVICNGVKFIIDYDAIMNLLRTNAPEETRINWDDVKIGGADTLWSISEMDNNVDIDGEDPVYMILYNASNGIIRKCDIIIWFPSRYPIDMLTDFTAKKLYENGLPELDTYVIECNDNKIIPWIYSYAGKTCPFGKGNIFEYIPSSSISIASALRSTSSSKVVNKEYAKEINPRNGNVVELLTYFNINDLETTSDESVMNRYFGWIQPRVTPIGNLKYIKMDDHVEYTRDVRRSNGDPAEDWCFVNLRDIEDFIPELGLHGYDDAFMVESGMVFGGDGCLRCLLGYGGPGGFPSSLYAYGDFRFDNFIRHYYLGSRIQAGCKDNPWSRHYREGYEYWGSLEWKCFDTSQALYLPDGVTVEIKMTDDEGMKKPIGDVKREAIEKICLRGMKRTTAHPEYFINRILDSYLTNIDVDINKTKYIIKFTLK